MQELHQNGLSSEAEKVRELAWLREHLPAFWVTAYEGHRENGRGAVVIDTTTEPLGENTPFYYVPHARFETQEDEVSLGLVKLISEYGPENQFVAAFIRPRDDELEFSMFQIKVGQRLVEAIRAYDKPESRPNGASTKLREESIPEPPDLETLIAWEADGGCEATDGCWVEVDGRCPHGKASWLLVLGYI